MQERKKSLYLTEEEALKLLKNEIGHGTDGRVLPYNKKELLKVYHEYLKKQKQKNDQFSDEVKIYHKKDLKFAKESKDAMYFYADEGNGNYIRLDKVEALTKAIARQPEIVLSKLPQRLLYIDGKVSGCTLSYQKGIPIHQFMGFPLPFKKKVLLKTLEAVKELIDHNIYPIDLDNSPYSTKSIYVNEKGIMEKVGHSHVLVSLVPFEIHLIDLDGKSTIYTNFHSDKFAMDSYASFTRLMKEFLIHLDLDEELTEEELENYYQNLGISDETLYKLTTEQMNYQDLKEFIKNYSEHKRRTR